MKKINDEVIRVLRIWGDHRAYRVKGLQCLGLPSETVESRFLMAPGRSDGRLNTSPSYLTNRTAIWVARKLRKLDSRSMNCLWTDYVQQMTILDAMKFLQLESKIAFDIEMEKAHKNACKLLNMRYFIYT